MRLCEPVWHAVDADPGLGEKLVSCFKIWNVFSSNWPKAVGTVKQNELINLISLPFYITNF
jgi:hypothetical protein